MPGLIRGIARTAAVAGTATVVSGRVRRRQAARYTERDAQIAADRSAAYQRDMGYNQPAPQQYAPAPAPAPAAPVEDPTIAELKQLAELHSSGVLSDDEFAAAKAKVLGT